MLALDGKQEEALAQYLRSLAVAEKLAAADPGDWGEQSVLAVALYKVATVAEPPQARTVLTRALAIVESLERANQLVDAQRAWPQIVRDAIATLPPEQTQAQ
jgi:hypothetical protein